MRLTSAEPTLVQRIAPGVGAMDREWGDDAPSASLELFERMLRRSFAAGVEREYVSFAPYQPLAGTYDAAVFHLVLRTTGIGGTPTVKIVFEDSSDGSNWTTMVTYTEAGPSDGTYRYVAPAPFGGFLRVRLLVSGSGGIGYLLSRGVLSVRRAEDDREWPWLEGQAQASTFSSGGCGGGCGGSSRTEATTGHGCSLAGSCACEGGATEGASGAPSGVKPIG